MHYALLFLLLSSCVKNEFTISGNLKCNSALNLKFIYYASDSKKGFVVETPVTVVDGKLSLHGVARNPTLVWVIDNQGRISNILYVERGDKIEIRGEALKPWLWEITGNKTEEELSQWIRANGLQIFLAGAPEVNREVSKYVQAHPESLTSAILLAAIYQPIPGREQEYDALLQKIPEKNRTNSAVIAAGNLRLYHPQQNTPAKFSPIVLYSSRGTTDTLNPAGARATLLYYWHRPDERDERDREDTHRFNMLMLKNLHQQYTPRQLQIADINCDLDTNLWLRAIRQDTIATWTRLWEPGYGMGETARRLAITGTPYMIVADSTGKILFRGYDIAETERTLKKIIDHRP